PLPKHLWVPGNLESHWRAVGMSALGQQRTCWAARKESALPPKADMLCGGEKSPLCARSGHQVVTWGRPTLVQNLDVHHPQADNKLIAWFPKACRGQGSRAGRRILLQALLKLGDDFHRRSCQPDFWSQ